MRTDDIYIHIFATVIDIFTFPLFQLVLFYCGETRCVSYAKTCLKAWKSGSVRWDRFLSVWFTNCVYLVVVNVFASCCERVGREPLSSLLPASASLITLIVINHDLYIFFFGLHFFFFYKARRILQQWAAAEYLNTSVPLNSTGENKKA